MGLRPITPRVPFGHASHIPSSGIKRTGDESGPSLLAQKLKMSNGKENITLRSLRCPHLVLFSPVCLPGTEAINRTLQQNWVLRMLHQNYQALYLLYLFSLDLLQREKFIAIIFILLFCCLYINEN